MMQRKILFIDRDGTLIQEPADKQVDCVTKFFLQPQVIPALLQLQTAGYTFVMVSNQDGLGTAAFPQEKFEHPQQLLLDILTSQGIVFDAIKICPHLPDDQCACRKPQLGLLRDYVRDHSWDRTRSYVIGDRTSDMALAEQLGIHGLQYGTAYDWPRIVTKILFAARQARLQRQTQETDVTVEVNLDQPTPISIQTSIGFFDHMLEQLAKHSGISMQCDVRGDVDVDEHHTIEDTALVLGAALRQALGDKQGIARYGFVVPMDEAQARVALDLSGRAYTKFIGSFPAQRVGALSTEMIAHFFRSFADGLQATLHIEVSGENTHHMVESIFKAVGRALRGAVTVHDDQCPSTKGVL